MASPEPHASERLVPLARDGRVGPAPPELDAEVCVVGGGPAGAVLARRLAALGHDVCLVERAPSAAGRPGELLAPGILPVLEGAGVRAAVEALAPLRARRAVLRWSSPAPALIVHGVPGLLISRARLDRALRDEAARAGAAVLCPATAGRPTRDGEGGWIVPIRAGERRLALHARFLCDATGRRGLLGGPRAAGVPTLALAAHLPGAGLDRPIIEAVADAWLWAAPIPGSLASVMAFVEPDRVRRSTGDERARLLRELLGRSALLRRWADVPRAVVHDATTFVRPSVVEPDAIRVGDACFAIDPLSAQGVEVAVSSALQAAIVVHTLLVAPERAGAAMQLYRERCAEAVGRHASWAARLYADRDPSLHEPFWTRRAADPPPASTEAVSTEAVSTEPPASPEASASPALPALPALPRPPAPGDPLALSPAASLAAIPCIAGDLVELGRALCHPALDRPLAYLGNTPIAPLLDELGPAAPAETIVARWARRVGPERARATLDWLVARGVIERAR